MKAEAFEVSDFQKNGGVVVKKIAGLTDGELTELKSMPNIDAEGKLMQMLDDRNDNLGTRWQCGYGVYAVWFDNEFAYVSIGTSCD